MQRNINWGIKVQNSMKWFHMRQYTKLCESFILIPDKLMKVHSFRSGFYCQSILNSRSKGLTEDYMKVLAQLLAGWKSEKDSSIYYKIFS